jgi:hypothetical protein
MDCSTSDDDHDDHDDHDDYNNDYYANCEDTMSINHFSSYRSYPTYAYSDTVKQNQVRQNLLNEQRRLEKIQKEKELWEKFENMALAKKVSFKFEK